MKKNSGIMESVRREHVWLLNRLGDHSRYNGEKEYRENRD